MDGWIDRWTNEWINGQIIDRWTNEWINGWMDRAPENLPLISQDEV